jgi:hypothetical protein
VYVTPRDPVRQHPAEVHAERDGIDVLEDVPSAEMILQPVKNAAGLVTAIVAAITDEDSSPVTGLADDNPPGVRFAPPDQTSIVRRSTLEFNRRRIEDLDRTWLLRTDR